MRKNAAFLFLSLFLLVFFACDLAIPKAIEIIGTPSTKFAEIVDVGKMFTDLLSDAINEKEGLTMIPCPETDIVTSLIHAELLDKEFDDLEDKTDIHIIFPDASPDLPDFIDVKELDDDKILIAFNPENRLIVPLSELGSLLPGFEFFHGDDSIDDDKGIYETKLYFSGADILEKSRIRIKIDEIEVKEDGEIEYKPIDIPKDNFDATYKSSDINKWKEEGYTGKSCPLGGTEIDIPITGKDISILFEIYIPAGKKLILDDFKAGKINVEVVVWLPFKFIAVDDDAALHFPDDSFFSSEDDLFGRDEPDSDSLIANVIESLSVDVKFNDNIFMGKDLVISSKGVDIHNLIESDWLSFTLTEDNMKEINEPENWPFIPDIKIGFTKGNKLVFPKEFNAIEFAFKAKLRYRKDFK